MRIFHVQRLLAAAAGLALLGLAGASQAETKSVMAQCSDMYKAEKAAGKLPAGQTWPKYFGECSKKMKADAGSTSAAATTKATTNTAASSGGSVMSQCSAQYKADKAANKVPAGQTWPKYYSACAAQLKASGEEANPPEPTKASLSAAEKTTDANGKAFTPGQIAAHKRIRECGQMWQADKAANKIKAGETWPKYWSACNTKLKAAGK